MNIINYVSAMAVPAIILLIIIYGVKEKIKVYDTFLEGAKEGLEVVINIFPTLIGIFLAVGALRASGILDLIINFKKADIIKYLRYYSHKQKKKYSRIYSISKKNGV